MTANKKEIDPKSSWQSRLCRASIKIQSELKADAKGYNYKYCTLQSLLTDGRMILGSFYITFFQSIDGKKITTELWDLADQQNPKKVKSCALDFPDIKIDFKEVQKQGEKKTIYDNYNQAMGETITYLRRYSLFALLNIQPLDDKDGEWRKKPDNRYQGQQQRTQQRQTKQYSNSAQWRNAHNAPNQGEVDTYIKN